MKSAHNRPDPVLYLDDHRGIYIPRDFARDTYRDCISGVKSEDLDYLAGEYTPTGDDDPDDRGGPDGEHYWDTWQTVLDNARVRGRTEPTEYTLYQDGALWLIPVGMEWDDREDWYRWPAGPNPSQRRKAIRVKASARKRRRGY
jgi:hypothetical protein